MAEDDLDEVRQRKGPDSPASGGSADSEEERPAGLPEGARLVCELDLFSDVELQRRIVVWSTVILALGLAAFAVMLLAGIPLEHVGFLLAIVRVAVGTAVVFCVHELIHGLFFRLLGGPDAHVRFEAKFGMLYTEAPGLVLSAGRYVVVLLAPTVIITVAVAVAGWVLGAPYEALAVLVLHLSGCTGDFAFLQAICVHRPTYTEDAATGVKMYC
jgi:hypothetical protein